MSNRNQPNKNILYKVVNYYELRDRKRIYSSTVVSQFSSLFLTYELNKIVYAPIGKLFCFNYYKDAKNWANSIKDIDETAILKCIAIHDKEIPLFKRALNIHDYYESLNKFWNNKLNNSSNLFSSELPQGTILCEAIMPIKECKF